MMPKFFSVIITIIIPLFLMPYATPGQSMQLVHLSGQDLCEFLARMHAFWRNLVPCVH